MAIRKPIVIVDGNHLSELPAGDSLMAHLDPNTTTLPQLIQAMVDAGVMAPAVVAVPQIVSVPVVSGAVFVGDTATSTSGVWTNSPTSYAYQWQVYDEINDEWDDVIGETASTFQVQNVGEYRVRVIASNSAGSSDPAYSAPFIVTESSGVPSYVNSADTGDAYYFGDTPTSVTLNGVTAGNSLLLVITGLNDLSGSGNMVPATLSNPNGATWGSPVLERSQDSFTDDRVGFVAYLAVGVSGGSHTITATWPVNGYVGMTLIELSDVSGVVASGTAGADGSPALPTNMGCVTSGNVSAGPCVAVGMLGLGHDWYSSTVAGDSNFVTRHSGIDNYAEGLVQTREFTAPGGSPVSWSASRAAANGATQGWASGIIVLR